MGLYLAGSVLPLVHSCPVALARSVLTGYLNPSFLSSGPDISMPEFPSQHHFGQEESVVGLSCPLEFLVASPPQNQKSLQILPCVPGSGGTSGVCPWWRAVACS